ncbi:hypothetical protein BKA58DRAFT_436854 [Alternaria rosae]|uniref:uncharacterized protein n=1 Tax=Alternaria rosae TaxID=1187941 RepID=UPI001E8ED622|nr:uncharacterized protein BKA58DRAFT_436854 [Alternaria rosae]KAH6879161.1 hypothetical protein BKA58DRAFT_436854 [Alternaria rosae]
MPALTSSNRVPVAHLDFPDWPLFLIILGVIIILLFQILFVFALLRWSNVRGKARWKRLRQRGVVILDGPALIWANSMPPGPTVSTFNLRQTLQTSDERVAH